MSFLLLLIFSLQQNQRTRGQNRFLPEAGDRMGGGRRKGEVTQIIYTHVNKCKTDKIKEKNKIP
jgi:hypothetical protein